MNWRPRIRKVNRNWTCCVDGHDWPRGIGETQYDAWCDWLRRLIVERGR